VVLLELEGVRSQILEDDELPRRGAGLHAASEVKAAARVHEMCGPARAIQHGSITADRGGHCLVRHPGLLQAVVDALCKSLGVQGRENRQQAEPTSPQ